jgi:hypothetical protein
VKFFKPKEGNMKMKHLVILVFCLALVFTTMTVKAEENHFKLYHVESPGGFEPFDVKLQDQFHKEPIPAKVIKLAFFANPVEKRHGENFYKIPDPNAHLTWYKIEEEKKPVLRTVKIENQFGGQILKVSEAMFLLVPTEKIEEGSSMPKEFNHFKAYKAEGEDIKPVTVYLRDQWDKDLVKYEIKTPAYFCNPVSKNGEPIYDSKYHLTCYFLDRKEPSPGAPKSIDTKDQFGKRQLWPQASFILCVPTKKLSWD